MTLSSASSQQLSTTTDSTVLVPVRALKNAMLMKVSYDNCRNELEVARDSVRLQDSIIVNQDATISVLVDQVDLFRANEKNYEEVVENKDKIIDLKDEEINKLKSNIRGAYAAIILTTVSFVLVLL